MEQTKRESHSFIKNKQITNTVVKNIGDESLKQRGNIDPGEAYSLAQFNHGIKPPRKTKKQTESSENGQNWNIDQDSQLLSHYISAPKNKPK